MHLFVSENIYVEGNKNLFLHIDTQGSFTIHPHFKTSTPESLPNRHGTHSVFDNFVVGHLYQGRNRDMLLQLQVVGKVTFLSLLHTIIKVIIQIFCSIQICQKFNQKLFDKFMSKDFHYRFVHYDSIYVIEEQNPLCDL